MILASQAVYHCAVPAGASVDGQPSSWAEDICSRVPRGSLVRWDDSGHFGPLEHPERLAEVVRSLPIWKAA